ncbi:MAG: sigma 54-interacting transcriptional regulator [Deltaproteobacteria bacterium]
MSALQTMGRGGMNTHETIEVIHRERGAQLVLFTRDGVRKVPMLPGCELLLGRGTEADIRIDDPSMSRKHAVLRFDPAGAGATLRIRDLESRNGVVLRGRKVTPWDDHPFEPGEQLELGDVSAVVHYREALPPAAGSAALPPIVEAESMRAVYALLDRVAPTDSSVLVLGETGVGKEIVAEQIHRRSRRRDAPFVAINCGALTDTVLESELFGHERGAFTGAVTAKVGLIESAQGGTVFLDEIGEMPLTTQVKLLRVLEERRVLPVGAVTKRAVDVRFVAATNRDLEERIRERAFREDFYYRLNGFEVRVPPLRERSAEVLPLARRFATTFAEKIGMDDAPAFTDAAHAALGRYPWPGNIRQLKNVVERAVVMAQPDPVDVEHLELNREGHRGAFSDADTLDTVERSRSLEDATRDLEIRRIREALDASGGNQTRAAKQLGITRSALIYRMKRYGIDGSKSR